jgi:hypothetical protein
MLELVQCELGGAFDASNYSNEEIAGNALNPNAEENGL